MQGFNRNTANYPNRKLETEISEDIEVKPILKAEN